MTAHSKTDLDPQALKSALTEGLMSFPITDFAEDGEFDEAGYRARLEWLIPYGAKVLFAAGGTGEGFSLTIEEHRRVIRAAVETCASQTPIIAGVGYNTRMAVEMARNAEAAGAAGIMLMPHYLTESNQEGLFAHIDAVCGAVGIGVVVYNRGVCKLAPSTVRRLADKHANLIGFKDGIGDIEAVTAVRASLGDRLSYLGGLPTAELFAEAYYGAGFPVYSSAVFNFIPRTAMEFYRAVQSGDRATTARLLRDFFIPYSAIRNRQGGYPVSIIKAGAKVVGRSAGPVRPPLSNCTEKDIADLKVLVDALGPQ
ncbi:5-dehydro-4-deoxyglucarate dehydratase [Devosia geojensis]|uniref:Probable 5-dehydro-4-deoxyglucarate dehydratase n=1 Tax=Devosia geojensis TaxID=443610 RepID=A0A0F5FD74_9HYPH|nr:5-dehydro-4-deoxyglucarate dehydratase [Devosia geojensis]KKB06743.1 5-dehydro-4-deoxyglucarate dehydratase [Devosia geojensis]